MCFIRQYDRHPEESLVWLPCRMIGRKHSLYLQYFDDPFHKAFPSFGLAPQTDFSNKRVRPSSCFDRRLPGLTKGTPPLPAAKGGSVVRVSHFAVRRACQHHAHGGKSNTLPREQKKRLLAVCLRRRLWHRPLPKVVELQIVVAPPLPFSVVYSLFAANISFILLCCFCAPGV